MTDGDGWGLEFLQGTAKSFCGVFLFLIFFFRPCRYPFFPRFPLDRHFLLMHGHLLPAWLHCGRRGQEEELSAAIGLADSIPKDHQKSASMPALTEKMQADISRQMIRSMQPAAVP